MKFCLGRDRDRLISNEHECVADGPESANDREFVRAASIMYPVKEGKVSRVYTLLKICVLFP